MFSKFKAKRRLQKLRDRSVEVNNKFDNDENIVFYGDRTGVWPIYKNLSPGNAVVYTFGIGNNISWEQDVVKNFDADVYSFDPTPDSVKWVSEQDLPPLLCFQPVGLADYNGTLNFFVPRRAGRFNYSVVKRGGKYPDESISCDVMDFSTICQKNQHSYVDVVKLDIEGSEMTALPSILESSVGVGQFLIEFHYNYRGVDFDDVISIIDQLFERNYELFWVSERGYEFGFVKL